MLVLLHLFALFLLVLLGFYIFVADPRNRAHQTFAAFIAFLAFWTTKDLIFWNFAEGRANAGWWAAASFVIALLMQYALVVFAWVFPENSRTPRKQAAVLFAPGLIFVPTALYGNLWSSVGFEGERFSIAFTPLAYAFVAYVYFLFFCGGSILFRKFRLYRKTIRGKQVGAILWGLVVTGMPVTLVTIILPFFGRYEFLPFSSILVLPGVFIYAYAISSFKLFSLQTALDQFRLFPLTFKVAISVASIAILSFTLFQIPIVWWAFQNGSGYEAWRKFLVFSVISALVPNLLLVLLVVRAISRPLQRITLAAVQVTDGQYGTEVDLRKSNDEIGLLADSFNEMSRKMAADILLLKDLNEQLVRTEKLASMGVLAAGVAHEVNNPLASISSLIQMLGTAADLTQDQDEKLKLISKQIERIRRVTKDMTDFARSTSAEYTAVDLSFVIGTSLRLAEFDRSFKQLTLTTELDPNIPKLHANPDQLQQVFLNLLLNARDAIEGEGRIIIRSNALEDHAVVEVIDSGSGIDNEIARFVFDPFFTTKPAGRGTGLGLAVCYGIITAHGGTIDVSGSKNGGTVFTVKLPYKIEPELG